MRELAVDIFLNSEISGSSNLGYDVGQATGTSAPSPGWPRDRPQATAASSRTYVAAREHCEYFVLLHSRLDMSAFWIANRWRASTISRSSLARRLYQVRGSTVRP